MQKIVHLILYISFHTCRLYWIVCVRDWTCTSIGCISDTDKSLEHGSSTAVRSTHGFFRRLSNPVNSCSFNSIPVHHIATKFCTNFLRSLCHNLDKSKTKLSSKMMGNIVSDMCRGVVLTRGSREINPMSTEHGIRHVPYNKDNLAAVWPVVTQISVMWTAW